MTRKQFLVMLSETNIEQYISETGYWNWISNKHIDRCREQGPLKQKYVHIYVCNNSQYK